MELKARLTVLIKLGAHLRQDDDYLNAVIHQTSHNNLWFTKANCKHAVSRIANDYLQEEALIDWSKDYFLDDNIGSSKLAIILSGRTPLENFHDVICSFLIGHKAQIILNEKDQFLLPYFIKLMDRFDDRSGNYLKVVNRLADFDAIICNATETNYNALSKYFEKTANIIRKRKYTVAVLDQTETEKELDGIANDIFTYFGLGTFNVSKLYLPLDFDFNPLMEKLHERKEIILHGKYKNNFDYNYSIYLLNKELIVANGCIILTENKNLHSRIAGLHYEFYENKKDLEQKLKHQKDEIEQIIGKNGFDDKPLKAFGEAFKQNLNTYAGGIDTMRFLLSLT